MTFQRTSLSFAKLSDSGLDEFGANSVASLTGNDHFPNLPVPVGPLGGLLSAFHTALIAAVDGGAELIARKDLARANLEIALRQNAAYVQGIAGENLPVLLSSGYKAVSTNHAQSPLTTPVVLDIDNQSSTQLFIDLKSVPNARTYQVKVTPPQGAALPTVESTRARKIAVPNLTPGTVYTVQVRAIGGSTGYSDWSNPTSCMAT